jgi:hypothetical protein
MKKLVILLVFLQSYQLIAADIYVNNSGQAGTYTTVSAAVAAAAANDRIFVSPYANYIENIVLSQNVTMACAVPGSYFSITGSLTITGAPNLDVRIIGAEFSGTLTANTGTATLANKADVYLVDSKVNSVVGQDYMKMHLLFSTLGFSANFRHGEMRMCNVTNSITISDGPNAGLGDTLFLIANQAAGITWANNDNLFYMSNNYINTNQNTASGPAAISISNHFYSATAKNLIINNSLLSYNSMTTPTGTVNLSTSGDRSNIWLYNNIMMNAYSSGASTAAFTAYGTGTGQAQAIYNYMRGSLPGAVLNQISGNTQITAGTIVSMDAYGRSTDATLVVDQGSPAIEFYDIDLTRNNRGSGGGGFTVENFIAAGAGRARVYNLTMPSEIWNGMSPSIKADGTHIK